MRKPHFFKAYSRIGLIHSPIRQIEANIGVENAPDFILTPDFLNKFPSVEVSEFEFTKPEAIKKNEYFQVLATELVNFKDQIIEELKGEEVQVVIGGDNTVTFSSLLADMERKNDALRIGYIQFDSHGESNSYRGSESKNFHGMYLRPFFAKFDIPEIEELVNQKLKPEQALFLGDLVLDGDEPEFFSRMGFQVFDRQSLLDNQYLVTARLRQFLASFTHIHINFDIDIFDPSVAGATGIAEDGKWQLEDVLSLLIIIKQHPSFSLDLSEVNPKKKGIEKTVKVAQQVLEELLS